MSDSANLREIPPELHPPATTLRSRRLSLSFVPAWLRGELVRKSLHMLIAFVPSIASAAGVEAALALLSLGTVVFALAEYLRLNGHQVAVITPLTVLASRKRDHGRFVLGPVTLAVGAMLSLLLYPSVAAALAIYALAFGDGIASLFGRAFGQTRIIAGKTVEGSLACFATVWFVALMVTGRMEIAMAIAVTATVLEALPTDDLDNVILPVGVGLVATVLLHQ